MTFAVRAVALGLAAKILAMHCALAHATDFILVKVTPAPGRVDVELTADYGGNPMFPTKADAQAVLSKVLEVQVVGKTHALRELAPLHFEDRSLFDPTTPIPLDAPGEVTPRQLLTAVWSWKSAAKELSFKMPEGAGQSVILWTPPAARREKVKWAFVLPGESSPTIQIPHRTYFEWALTLGVGFAGVMVAWGTKPSWNAFRRS